MKRNTPNHPKIGHLSRLLGKPRHVVCGLLELLWHFAAQYAPAGDVGKHTDEAIAEALDWKDAPAALVAALVDAKWLDPSDTHRLIVHDWPQHCDDGVHTVLARRIELFATGEMPSLRKLNKQDRQEIEAEYARRHGAPHNAALCPAQTRASASANASAKPQPQEPPVEEVEAFDRFWQAWPENERKVAKPQCLKHWNEHDLDALAATILPALEAAKASKGWKKDAGAFIPKPLKWLSECRWEAMAKQVADAQRKAEAATAQRQQEAQQKQNDKAALSAIAQREQRVTRIWLALSPDARRDMIEKCNAGEYIKKHMRENIDLPSFALWPTLEAMEQQP